MKKHYFTGIILIIIGITILLFQNDWIDFSRADFVTYGCIAVGILFLWKGFQRTDKRGILGGVFFTAYGATMLLMRERVLPRDDEFGLAAFFLVLAIANFVYMFYKSDKITNLIWGSIFGIIGALFLWIYYGYYPSWYVYDQIELYWPLILVLIGAGMIVKGISKRRHQVQTLAQ
jgi:hypothetical protein